MPKTTASFGRFSSTAALTQHLLIALLPSMLVAVILIVTLALDKSPNTSAREQNFIDAKLTAQTHQLEHLDKFIWSEDHQRWLLAANGQQPSSDAEVLIRNSEDNEGRRKCVWPEDNCAGQDDRIIDQLRLQVPDGQRVVRIFPPHAMVRSYSLESTEADEQQEEELIDDCRRPDVARQCRIVYNLDRANVVIFPNADVIRQPKSRRADQIWVAYLLESPPNTFPERYQRHHRGRHEFNWTASYRSDSDIVAPYAKFVPYHHYHQQQQQQSLGSSSGLQHRVDHDDNIVENLTHRQLIHGKRKKVAWFASNCHTANKRREFVKELSKFIQVDVYGRCGSFTCDKWNQTGCLGMLNNDYKFYLAFENSNSPEYITEKLFQNALGGNNPNYLLLPIVMGPSRNDYERLAPPNSFIHVNDFSGSAERLADYLKLLDSNDSLYYSYFSWKTMGRFVDTKFMCRVCLLAHETFESGKTKIYTDLKGWYTGKRSI